jgi:hypothetical protein
MSQSLIFTLICTVVVLLWSINTLIPRDYKIRRILNILVTLVVVVGVGVLLNVFGTNG